MDNKELDKLEALAKAATPQNFDSAQITNQGCIECPSCDGSGEVELTADYCNYDGRALGVQFYGIGPEHRAAEAFYRAANPAAILELIALARAGSAAPAAPTAEQIANVILRLIGECAMDWCAGPTGNDEDDAFSSDDEELRVLVGLVNKALTAPTAAVGPSLTAEHRATIEEAASVLESAAAHNRFKYRTVLANTQQDRADRLRLILAAQPKDTTDTKEKANG